jgi:hypothetical protein
VDNSETGTVDLCWQFRVDVLILDIHTHGGEKASPSSQNVIRELKVWIVACGLKADVSVAHDEARRESADDLNKFRAWCPKGHQGVNFFNASEYVA